MEQAKLHLSAFLWVAGLIGAISTVAGLFKGHTVYIFTAAGYIGMAALLPLAIFYGVGWGSEPKRLPLIGIVSTGFGVVCLMLFPLRDFEVDSFNTLSAIGILVIVGLFIWGVSVYREYEKAQKPAEKVCPDCARTVLMAARVCEHCGYRFEPLPKVK
jgi:hypothetical protein